MDLFNKIQEFIKELDTSISKLVENGKKYAKHFRDYRVLLAKKLTELKLDGVPATLASDIARGTEEVANAKYDEICSEVIYKANLEHINITKLKIKIYDEQLSKEWGNTK